jgi:hypothetical protein
LNTEAFGLRPPAAIGRALLFVAENVVGADDPPEPVGRIDVAGIVVRMVGFGGLAERCPEAFGVIVSKCTKQIVKGYHHPSRNSDPQQFPLFSAIFPFDQ